ncbi:ABC transporter permease [Ruminiclostridium herbifermentans]|uniref:ABC transporter permease n=1 Tax=Ruminiclostridium herbifermentans TaxID=2488810 RepID=A0A4U7JJI9_9FIRM|nr:FtsX-like permease family protein [Ruminiclostridium herbifermentans]QNU66196.1 ABC transporter permease [Ruminiclostridium herbifermentans]
MVKLAFRNLFEHKVRTFLTGIGIVLAVALVLGVDILNRSMLGTLQDIYMGSGHKTDIIAIKSGDFTSNDIKYIKGIPNVSLLAPLSACLVKLDSPLMSKVDAGVKGIDIKTDQKMRDYYFLEGGWFSSKYKRELIIDKTTASKIGVSCYDNVRLSTRTGDKIYKVIGIIEPRGAGLPSWIIEMYAPLETITADSGFANCFNRIDIALDDEEMAMSISEEIKKHFTDTDIETQTLVERQQMANRTMSNIRMGFNVVLSVIIFAGCMLIYNTFCLIINERIQLIGMLKAIGMGKYQTIKMILCEGIVLGLVGTFFGVLLGLGIGKILIPLVSKISRLGSIDVEYFIISPKSVITSVAIGLITPLISCLLPAYKASKYSPIQALKNNTTYTNLNYNSKNEKKKFFIGLIFILTFFLGSEVLTKFLDSKISTVIMPLMILFMFMGFIILSPLIIGNISTAFEIIMKKCFKINQILSVRNITRNINRTAITTSVIIIGIAMSIGLNGLFNSIKESSAKEVEKSFKSDIIIRTSQGSSIEDFENKINLIKKTQGVNYVYYTGSAWSKDKNNDSQLITGIKVPDQIKMGYFDILSGDLNETYIKMNEREKVAIVGQYYSKNLGYKTGDILNIKGISKEYPFVITTIVNTSVQNGNIVYIDRDILDSIYSQKHCDFIGVKANADTDISALREKIDKTIIKDSSIIVSTAHEYKEMVRNETLKATTIFSSINIIIIIIALFGLVNTLLMGVLERKHEIGILRSIGSSKKQIKNTILGESMLIGVLGTVIGFIAGISFVMELKTCMENISNVSLSLYLPYKSIYTLLILTLLGSFVASIFPFRMAVKVGIIDAIKGE